MFGDWFKRRAIGEDIERIALRTKRDVAASKKMYTQLGVARDAAIKDARLFHSLTKRNTSKLNFAESQIQLGMLGMRDKNVRVARDANRLRLQIKRGVKQDVAALQGLIQTAREAL